MEQKQEKNVFLSLIYFIFEKKIENNSQKATMDFQSSISIKLIKIQAFLLWRALETILKEAKKEQSQFIL